ncbi:ArsR/SmtB family transcription factor [Streptomyces anulatus]|uniref:ArsR/SmtB family transcription factor n=1 Tax=Streptomyces anulatus TaxID=1892 RepID=UPI0035DC0F1E
MTTSASRPAGPGSVPPPRPRVLAALLGVTRARVLVRIAARDQATTSDLVGELEVSAATVSHHTAVLRESALITSRRDSPG